MNTLLSIRTNIIYSKKYKENKTGPDEFLKLHELIFLVDKPKYKKTNLGEIIKEREVEELRFTVSEKNFEILIENLIILKGADESELT